MRLPTSAQTLQDIARSRFAQAERLECELAALHETWGPASHPFMRRWLDGDLSADGLRLFAGEHYHAICALADVAARAARMADGLLAEQLAAYAAGQERALSLWLRFAGPRAGRARPGTSARTRSPRRPPAPRVALGDGVAGRAPRHHLGRRVRLAPLAGAQCEVLRRHYGFDHAATRYFARRARRGEHDAAVAQAGLTSLLPVTSPLALVCRADLAWRSYLELVDGVARQLSGA